MFRLRGLTSRDGLCTWAWRHITPLVIAQTCGPDVSDYYYNYKYELQATSVARDKIVVHDQASITTAANLFAGRSEVNSLNCLALGPLG